MNIRDIVFIHHMKESVLVDWHSRVHSHGDGCYELHYFLSGKGSFRNGDQTFSIDRGQLFFSLPNVIHGIQPGEMDDPLTYYAVLFDLGGEGDPNAVKLEDPAIAAAFPVTVGPIYRLRFEDMKNRYNSRHEFHRLAARFELLAFLFDLLGRMQAKESDIRPEQGGSGDVYVEQAMDIFQKHISGGLHLGDVAGRLRISEEYLIKIFRRRIGITPMRYYQNLKLEAAVSMLLNTGLSIKEISARLGFSSQYHFSRNFHEFAGQSPSEYRLCYFRDNPTNYQTRIIG